MRFAPGRSIVCRDVFRGRVAFARAFWVVEDRDDLLSCFTEPGAECRMQSTYLTGDRLRYLHDLAAGTWTLEPMAWHSSRVLLLLPPETWYAYALFFDPESGELRHYYVNFQEPWRRTHCGFDTFDLCLDLVVTPERRWYPKDESELELAVELGVVSPAAEASIRRACDEVITQIERGQPPFDGSSSDWRPPPDTEGPRLPSGWADL